MAAFSDSGSDRRIRSSFALSMPLTTLGSSHDHATMDRAMAVGVEFVKAAAPCSARVTWSTHKGPRDDHGFCIHCYQPMPTIYSGAGCTAFDTGRGWARHSETPLDTASSH